MVTYRADDVSIWQQSKNPTIQQNVNGQIKIWCHRKESEENSTNVTEPSEKTNVRKTWLQTGLDKWWTRWRTPWNFGSSSKKFGSLSKGLESQSVLSGIFLWWTATAVLLTSNWPPSSSIFALMSVDMPALCKYLRKSTSTLSSGPAASSWCRQTDRADQSSFPDYIRLPVCLRLMSLWTWVGICCWGRMVHRGL